MGSIVIIEVLPFFELFIKEVSLINNDTLKHLIKIIIIDGCVLPFHLAKAGKRQIWNVLALYTAGGLVSSTLFILAIVPIFYFYIEK